MSESTTAISTVAVRSGATSIVIALLQSKDSLELKVVDVNPCLTQLADTLEEASEWRKAHADVIHKIKSKKSPVAELGDQAESVMANQKTSPKVYNAMSDSLAAVWENVNKHLEERAKILDLNLSYHKNAEEYHDHCKCLEILADSELPVEIEEMRERMVDLKEGLRGCLSCLNGALRQGTALLDILVGLEDAGTLDSRPQHIKLQAQLAKVQVERWMEALHEKRRWIQKKVEMAHAQLEECLGLALITADLTLLKRLLTDRTEAILNSKDQLGDSSASAELLLHEHRKIIPEAKDLQEQALKIVRATEEFAEGGHFAGPEAIREAYLLLEEASIYLSHISSREAVLQRAIEFFKAAQSALIKLDQLEVQLTTASMGLGSSTPKSTVSKNVEDISQPSLEQGYALLQDVPNAEGVKRTVEQIENKKINLTVQLANQQEENTKAKEIYNSFIEKYNSLNAFLTSMVEYLKGVREMGSNLSSSKEYLQTYKKNLNDLQNKGTEITAFVSTIPATIEQLDAVTGQEVQKIGDQLREVWSGLNLHLERRIRHCAAYSKALDLGSKLQSELDSLDKAMAALDESDAKQIWVSVQQLKAQFDNTSSNFERDSREIGTEGGLDLESGRQCLRNLAQELSSRIESCEDSWKRFSDALESRHKDRQLWETNMAASNKTVDWVSKLDAQLYPVLNPELHTARQLVNHVEEKLNTVLPEIRRAQKEIQLRIDTAEALLSKSDFKGANDGIPIRLKELNSRLNTISADYQVLLEKLLTFFNSLAQVESKIESIQREQQTAPLARTLEDAIQQMREFEATKYAMTEMFHIALVDSGQIIDKVKSQEGANCDSDIRTIEKVVESVRYSWQRVSSGRESALSKQESRCRFDQDLGEVHKALDTLGAQLTATRGRYGENIVEAKATSAEFATFERTIVLLEERINDFSRMGRELAGDENTFEREIQSLRNKWNALREQVVEARRLIDMAEVFFTLVDEAEDWFREGNRVLVSIAQRSTKVSSPEEAQVLLEEINLFLKPGEERQNRRIDEISQIALELWGDDVTSHLKLVKSGSKEILDSFNQVSDSLKQIAARINTSHPIIEHMDVDVQVDSRSRPVEDWQSHLVRQVTTSSTVIEKQVNIRTETATPVPPVEEERLKKSPSPPLKKIKVQEQASAVPPYFTSTLVNSSVEEGKRFTFQCRVTGNPVPDIVWEKDGIPIQNNPDYQVKFEDGLCSLTIEETFAEDTAKYTCRGHNDAGIAETSGYLSIFECEPEVEMIPPTFVTPLSLVNCDEGGKLELRCHVTGVPLPTVQWFHEDKCLDNDGGLLITFNNGEAVLVKEEAAPQDEGQYSCLAVNQKGTEKTMARVVVRKRVEPGQFPSFSLDLGNVMARAGQKIKLEAEANGSPPPTLVWTKDGKSIKDSRDLKITREGTRTTLVIQEAFPKDAGLYEVTATNPVGTAVSSSQVTVKGRLPQESSDTEVQVRYGANENLKCSSTSRICPSLKGRKFVSTA
uniref:Ig-like domain-containing protein n=2 Tax=Lygus hesperus TaxID=30085 RepID=A0A0K8S6A5_LYGHE